VLVLLAAQHVSATTTGERAVTNHRAFAVIADVQYADAEPASGRHFRESLEKLEKCVADLNSRDLLFAIQLGDFIDRDEGSFDAILPVFDQLAMPTYHVLGNHDLPTPKETVLAKLGLERGYYAFSHDDWCFVVLDTVDVIVEHDGRWSFFVGEGQREWLRDTLSSAMQRNEKAIVFGHMPVVAAPGRERALIANHAEVRGVLEESGCVAAYFNGHAHRGGYALWNGIHYVNVEAMVEGAEETAYAVIELYEDRMEVRGVGQAHSYLLQLLSAAPSEQASATLGLSPGSREVTLGAVYDVP
jgi:hypothetical protein